VRVLRILTAYLPARGLPGAFRRRRITPKRRPATYPGQAFEAESPVMDLDSQEHPRDG